MTVVFAGIEYAITVTDASDDLYCIDENGNRIPLSSVSATYVTSYTLQYWFHGIYVVEPGKNVGYLGRISIMGPVVLILGDESSLAVSGGFYVNPNGGSLTIYRQEKGTGKLTVTNVSENNAGIGGNDGQSCGRILIGGGKIDVTGGYGAAGIGGGASSNNDPSAGDGGIINIYGGTVTASGGVHGAGIGGGEEGYGGNITISGGTVTANGGSLAAGIGGGWNYRNTIGNKEPNGGTIRISGGEVTANGGEQAAGIGGGYRGATGNITISSGKVIAVGRNGGAGIGGGMYNNGNTAPTGGEISISGGEVHASGVRNDDKSEGYGAGIGGGYRGGPVTIAISGGTITADGGKDSAGIGGGGFCDEGKITITAGTVTASGGYFAEAIGNGEGRTVQESLTLDDGMRAGIEKSETVEWADAGDRVSVCRSNYSQTVRVESCTHDDVDYIDNDEGQHSVNCRTCVKIDGTLYDHTYTNHFCVCGAEQPNHKVTFYANNDTTDSAVQKIYDGEETALTENSFSWENLSFAGWNTAADGSGTPYAASARVSLTDDLELYGQWASAPVNAPQITGQPEPLSLIYGYEGQNKLSVKASADEGCTLVYQWYSYTQEDKSDLQAITGAGSDQYDIPEGMDVGTTNYYCEVKAVRSDGAKSEAVLSDAAAVTIAQREVTVTAKNADDITYDTKEHTGSTELTFTNIVYGQTASITYKPAKGTKADTYEGTFGSDFKVLDGDTDVTGNYKLTETQLGKLTIRPARLTITAKDQNYVYNGKQQGEGDTAYDDPAKIEEKVDIYGLQSGDTVTSLVLDGERTDVGQEDITVSSAQIGLDGEDNVSYDIKYVSGILSIESAIVTVTARKASKEYGATDPAFKADVTDVLPGDPFEIVYEVSQPGSGKPENEQAGVYEGAVVPSGAELQGNYKVTYVPADFEITKAGGLTVTAAGYEGVYDGNEHFGSASANITEGTTIEYSEDGKVWSKDAPGIKDVGEKTYQVRATNSNYKNATAELTLKVTPAKAKYTVRFYTGSRGNAPADQTVEEGGKAVRPEDPSASGYTFGGWFTDRELRTEFDFDTPITENTILYAKWTANNASGGGTNKPVNTSGTAAGGKPGNAKGIMPAKTGDENPVGFWLILAAASALGLLFMISKRRRV